jgi:glycosyltransferase involved in cell wall biosynthesis
VEADLDVWKSAHLVLSCSPYVTEGIGRLGGEIAKVAVVPYGVAEDWVATPPRTVPKRILFAGSVGLLKGSHYFAEARRILLRRGLSLDFRVIGNADPVKISHPLFQGPTYVGHVNRDEVRKEFAEADVFVMPTISDGFALAQLEAMSCGVPVVATPHCGALVRDGVDGYVVPIRNALAIADAVERIVTDRRLREQLSENARRRASEFTWSFYEKRLVEAILAARAAASAA